MLLRSGATLVITWARDAGSETTALTPLTPGTAALVCAAPCATGTPKNGVTWVSTPTDAGWATGARTSTWVAALTSTWSARGASWRSRRLWHTAPTLDLAPPTTAGPTMADPTSGPTMALTMGPTMASTMAQAPTKDYAKARNYIKRLAKIKQKLSFDSFMV